MFVVSLWRIVFGVCALCALTAVATSPMASATPDPCSASGLAATSSGVLNAASGYLDGHPDANNVLTAAVSQPPADARSSVRGLLGHPGEALELKGIAQPLLDLRGQCNTAVTPDQLAALFDALSG